MSLLGNGLDTVNNNNMMGKTYSRETDIVLLTLAHLLIIIGLTTLYYNMIKTKNCIVLFKSSISSSLLVMFSIVIYALSMMLLKKKQFLSLMLHYKINYTAFICFKISTVVKPMEFRVNQKKYKKKYIPYANVSMILFILIYSSPY